MSGRLMPVILVGIKVGGISGELNRWSHLSFGNFNFAIYECIPFLRMISLLDNEVLMNAG